MPKQLKPITDKNGVHTHRWVGTSAGTTYRTAPDLKAAQKFDPMAYGGVPNDQHELAYDYSVAVLKWEGLVRSDPDGKATKEAYDAMNKLDARVTKLGIKVGAERYLIEVAAESRVVNTSNLIGENPIQLPAKLMDAVAVHVEASEISISVSDESVLWKILSDGVLRSAAEDMIAHKERIPLYMESRYRAEEAWFGIPREQVELRPVYAALTNPKRTPDLVESSSYGDIQIVLKPEAKKRSTFTIGDSFNSNQYHIRPFLLEEENPFVGVSDPNAFAFSKMAQPGHTLGSIEYVEAQIHGGVTLDDIQEIRLPEWKEMTQELANFIADKGIVLKGGDIF